MSVFSHLCCSTTITFASQNSSDLDVGRRPELKSGEFCEANVTVVQIISQLCLKPLKQVVQLFDPSKDFTKFRIKFADVKKVLKFHEICHADQE